MTSLNAYEQDPHFSQYHASPLTLNPAMTGSMNSDSRFSGNFRQQWWGVGNPFTTGTISYDTKLIQSKMKKDIFGLGILGMYDQSSDGSFKNNNLALSLSYHKALDAQANSTLGIGFQLMYASRFINTNKLNFANQFNGYGFDTDIPSNETFGNLQRNYFDLNAGLLYTYRNDNVEAYAGGSIYHIGNPNINFLQNDKYKLPQRYTAHVGSRFFVGNNNEIFFGGLYMYQAGAQEENLGISYGLNVNSALMVYGGLWYRIQDAFIPFIGLDYKNLSIGFSYDINNSDLKDYTSKNGSFEVSFIVVTRKPINPYRNYKKGRVF